MQLQRSETEPRNGSSLVPFALLRGSHIISIGHHIAKSAGRDSSANADAKWELCPKKHSSALRSRPP